MTDASGVRFLCPKCFAKNGGSRGTHSVICWFVGKVPDYLDPKPGRWTPNGIGLDDLTFIPGEPHLAVSVLLPGDPVTLIGGCGWHGHVSDGEATLQ